MTTPYTGEIQLFGFNFAPYAWAFCNGATLRITQNTALFSLLGTQYGGDGTTTFQLPNLVGRAPCSQGQGPGLTSRTIGGTFGENGVTLLTTQIPSHTHALTLLSQSDTTKRTGTPATGNALSTPTKISPFAANAAANAPFALNSIAPAGGNQPHENRQPYLAVNFCIALQGVYPSFN
ncbi:microcystin-dependent protein [Frateuria sp. Soil773]|uniref:phage tail protein n=1 Tax=Frateuria sp. Soil773 TaxID=1736407 RepID=UPI0006F4D94D|nr:tail fiber protein [Frateuria sp. Soil773]KRF00544.1 microcystin-dependent protein [Frateuria sp. Soil773]